MKLNPHPSCGCRCCRHVSSSRKGFVKKLTNRRIRRLSARLIHQGSTEPPIVDSDCRA